MKKFAHFQMKLSNSSDYDKVSELFKALSEPIRLQIIDLVLAQEICACKILECLSISQSTLSHHMKILMECGLVTGRKQATWMYYSINNKTIENLRNIINLIKKKRPLCSCPFFSSKNSSKKEYLNE